MRGRGRSPFLKLRSSSSPVPLGTLFENEFTESDYTESGAVSATFNGDSITIIGSGGSLEDVVRYNPFVTCRNNLIQTIRFTVDTFTVDSYGCGIKFVSVNGVGQRFYFSAILITSNNSERGKIYFYGSDEADQDAFSLGISSASPVAVSLNDTLELNLTQNDMGYVATGYNLTQDPSRSSPVTLSYQYDTAFPFVTVYHNSAKLGLVGFGGTQTVNYWNVRTDEFQNVDLLIIGDSKVRYNPDLFAEGFAQMWKDNNPTKKVFICFGASDKTTEMVQCLPELVQYRPRYAILLIGRNDIANGVSSAVWQANIDSMYGGLTDEGTIVYFQLPLPETVLDQSALTTYLTTTYPTRCISVPGTWNDVTDNADGIHPNSTGHPKVYNNQITYITL